MVFDVVEGYVLVSAPATGHVIVDHTVPAGEKWIIRSVSLRDNKSKFPGCLLAVGNQYRWKTVVGVATPSISYIGGYVYVWSWTGVMVAKAKEKVRLEIRTNENNADVYGFICFERLKA